MPTMTEISADSRNLPFVAEYRREPAYQKSMTLEQFVAMRRIDERIDPLAFGGNQIVAANSLPPATSLQADRRNDRFVAEYRAEPGYAQTMTLEAYVAMRRVDEGIDQLLMATV